MLDKQVPRVQFAHPCAGQQVGKTPPTLPPPPSAGAFRDMLLNWVLSVQRLGLPFVVGALDARMAAECAARGWPHLDVSALVNGQESAFRTNFSTFRNMGATKVGAGRGWHPALLAWRAGAAALGRSTCCSRPAAAC